jgi:aryl-alcohol dehydrogenase-like predicted oxidoreductase
MPYGIVDPGGQVPQREVVRILDMARRLRLEVVDTAFEYGDSEEVLGATLRPADEFRLVTKTRRLRAERISDADAESLRASFLTSLARLRRERVYGLLVHDPADLLAPGADRLYAELTALKRAGLVCKIGASVYTGHQLDAITDRFALDLAQVPVNVLDQRLVTSGHLVRLKTAGIEVHARSAFLQGLLLANPAGLDERFDSVRDHLSRYRAFLARAGIDPVRAAIGFVVGLPQVDHVVVGVLHAEQLEQAAGAAAWSELQADQMTGFAWHDESILDPRLW